MCLETKNNAYELYHLELRKPGFQSMVIQHVKLFATHCTLMVALQPIKGSSIYEQKDLDKQDGGHALYSTSLSHANKQLSTKKTPSVVWVKDQNHMELIEVSFLDYLKFVANSWIYPTWPYEAQKALLWILSSRILAALENEDKTQEEKLPPYQPYQLQYETTNQIIDTIFPSWLCTLEGEDATQSYTIWDVVQQSLGGCCGEDLIQWVFGASTIVQEPFCLDEDLGEQQLTQVANYLPSLQNQISLSDRITAFQKQFDLKMSGQFNAATLQKLEQVYLRGQFLDQLSNTGDDTHKEQAQLAYLIFYQSRLLASKWMLTSNMPTHSTNIKDETWEFITMYHHQLLSSWKEEPISPPPLRTPLALHATGSQVQLLQQLLHQLSAYYPAILDVICDGCYDVYVQQSVTCFQDIFNLPCTGVVDTQTWHALHQAVYTISKEEPSNKDLPFYSKTPSTKDATSDECRIIQTCLLAISKAYPSIHKVQVDNVFGTQTRLAIIDFQTLLGIPSDGELTPFTRTQLLQLAEELTVKKM